MKEKLFTSIKGFNQKPVSFSGVFVFSIYLTFLSLSIKSNKLFLQELILCGTIIGLALLNGKKSNYK